MTKEVPRISVLRDEALIARLRELGDHASFEPHMHHKAADRIEELEQLVATLEAKLAKAVEIAEVLSGAVEYDYHGNAIDREERKAMADLADLKGESHG